MERECAHTPTLDFNGVPAHLGCCFFDKLHCHLVKAMCMSCEGDVHVNVL